MSRLGDRSSPTSKIARRSETVIAPLTLSVKIQKARTTVEQPSRHPMATTNLYMPRTCARDRLSTKLLVDHIEGCGEG